MEKLEEFVKPFKDFIIKYHSNPVLWVSLVLIGLIVFGLTYNALHKDK